MTLPHRFEAARPPWQPGGALSGPCVLVFPSSFRRKFSQNHQGDGELRPLGVFVKGSIQAVPLVQGTPTRTSRKRHDQSRGSERSRRGQSGGAEQNRRVSVHPTAHSGRNSGEFRHPVRGSVPQPPTRTSRKRHDQSRERSGPQARGSERSRRGQSGGAEQNRRVSVHPTAHSGRNSGEFRRPVRGSVPQRPPARTTRKRHDQSRERSGPQARGSERSRQGQNGGTVQNRRVSVHPTAHSGRNSAEFRHPVRGSAPQGPPARTSR
jgi:hypothetical protein